MVRSRGEGGQSQISVAERGIKDDGNQANHDRETQRMLSRWRFHLRVVGDKLILELMITKGVFEVSRDKEKEYDALFSAQDSAFPLSKVPQ